VALDETGVWRAAFEEARFLSETPRRLQEAQTQMVNHLGRAYQAHERQSRQYANLLQGVVQTVDLCEGLQPDNDAPATGEALAAVQRVLLDLLAGHGVLRWECAPGDPLGEGCEVVGIEERDDLPEHVIASVVAPGYRRPDGEVLRRPRVTISRAPAPTPAAEPEAAPPEQAPEPEIPSPEAAQEHENASDAGENREP
jgi:molecular chaperone GrpE (heat shock protein)